MSCSRVVVRAAFLALLLLLIGAGGVARDTHAAASPHEAAFAYDDAWHDYDRSNTLTWASVGAHSASTRVYDGSFSTFQGPHTSVQSILAAKAGDDALRTVAALTREQDAALAAAMRDPNKLRHIFGKPQHNLGPLTRELGGQEALMREAVLAVPRGTTGTFEVTKRIGTYDLTVRGRVVNGVPRIGTVFVP